MRYTELCIIQIKRKLQYWMKITKTPVVYVQVVYVITGSLAH